MAHDAEKNRGLRVLIVPEGGGTTRTFRLGPTGLRVAAGTAVVVGVALLVMASTWWYFAARSARVSELQARVDLLEGQQPAVERLVARLQEVEERYENLRVLFGIDTSRLASDLWLPPSGAAGSGEGDAGPEDEPSSWPLTERGFITQPLVAEDESQHQGLDIAIPSHSYIRAAGAAEVAEVGQDSIYGRYILLDHGQGYRSLYGHAASTLVQQGQQVRRNEVIGLSGSTGRSTAPHLHFEILREGNPIDPLTLVQQP